MKRLIYTAVFNGYDRVYPPVHPEPDVDYVIVTDDAALSVPGWQIHHVGMGSFANPKAANLHYRAMIHRFVSTYDASLYIDGNIRLLGSTLELFNRLMDSGAALMWYPHPLRRTISEELSNVIATGKVANPMQAQDEVRRYLEDGYPDQTGLGETTVLFKNHRNPALDEAMTLWADLFATHLTRDQLSLPYVIWKTGLSVEWLPGTFREPNPYFALYPHIGSQGVNPFYVHVSARSHDSRWYKALLQLWHAVWVMRRMFRRLTNPSAE